jgi:hypothetical protein
VVIVSMSRSCVRGGAVSSVELASADDVSAVPASSSVDRTRARALEVEDVASSALGLDVSLEGVDGSVEGGELGGSLFADEAQFAKSSS